MPKNEKDRELTKKELEGITGGKAAQQDPHKGVRTPYGSGAGSLGRAVRIDPDHVPQPDPIQTKNRSKK